MKDKIIEILAAETFNMTDEAGNVDIVVSRDDFENIAEKIVNLFTMRPHINSISVKVIPDDSPDMSWLDQFENSTNPDEIETHKWYQERKAKYGDTWYMVGVRAEVEIFVPFMVTTNEGEQQNFSAQTIKSGGLWGIETDSDTSYFKEVAREEIDNLKESLAVLNVKLDNFEECKNEALQNMEI